MLCGYFDKYIQTEDLKFYAGKDVSTPDSCYVELNIKYFGRTIEMW